MLESNKGLIILSAAMGFWLLYLLSPILSPFIIAATLAYIGDPFVDKLESWKLSRTMAVACLFIIFALILFIVLLVGDKIGLHPVAVIFAIMAGGQLFGFVGVLVALPISAVIMVLIRHLLAHYKQSALYQ